MLRRFLPPLLALSIIVAPLGAAAQSIDQLFRQGNAAQAAGDFAEAEQVFRRVIQLDPQNAVAYYNLGNALYNQGNLEEAIASYRQAIEIDPQYAYAYFNLGIALYDQGDLEGTIASYRRAIELNPQYAGAYTGLGNALADQGNLEEAIASYRRAIELDPQNARAYFNLGLALRSQGKLEEAIASYRRAIELNPQYVYAYHNLGNALYNQGNLEEAIANYRRALELDPQYAHAYSGLGNALRIQGNLEEAIANYRQALNSPDRPGSLTSAHAYAYNNWGVALKDQGNLREAIANFQKAVDLDPDYTLAQNNLRETQRLLAVRLNPQPLIVDDRLYVPSATDEPLAPILRSTARIIARVSEGSLIGTGWVVKRTGDTVWIVTNRHVISDERNNQLSDTIEVEFFSELPDERRPRYEAVIEHLTEPDDFELDLAVLRVAGVPPDILPLEFQSGRVQRLTRIYVIGHPYNVDAPWNAVSGEVTNFDRESPLLPLNVNIAEGNSGGPVINQDRLIIGMVVKYRTGYDVAFNPDEPTPVLSDQPALGVVGLAYRIDVVVEQLRTWGVLD